MAALMDEDQHDKARREPPAPNHGVYPNREDHGAAGFEDDREKFKHRKHEEFQFPQEIEDQCEQAADRAEILFEFVAKGDGRWWWLMQRQWLLGAVHAGDRQPASHVVNLFTRRRPRGDGGLYKLVNGHRGG